MNSDLWVRRAGRAAALAERYRASAEILAFTARLRTWQSETAPRIQSFADLSECMPALLDLVRQSGPGTLVRAGDDVAAANADSLLRDHWESPGILSAPEFFARALLELYAASLPDGIDCPWCVLAPQCGCLTSQGDGQALQLVCALCFRRRSFPRTRCPLCGESSGTKLPAYSTPELSHLRLSACDSCMGYLIVVDLERDVDAVPEIDELVALPLDMWAVGHGYRKLQPNLAGV